MRRIERDASRISDPVERLRYLRKSMDRKGSRLTLRSLGWLGLVLLIALAPGRNPSTATETLRPAALILPDHASIPRVWIVEHSSTTEVYSNGLQIDLTFATLNRPRAVFHVYATAGDVGVVRTEDKPAGIVFHTTESHLVPFEEDENHALKQLGRNLLDVIQRAHAYHYVIDRFGRVFRVVEESQAANHAGKSVWGGTRGIYVDLNDSFLGVALEAQTDAIDAVTPAQVAAAKVLTEMLRSRYGIAAEDCVTHAQVSVNPFNMHIGLHTDWAGRFPFAGLGLPDNYSIPLASLYAFGFEYDDVFLQVTGTRWKGLDRAEAQVQRRAEEQGMTVARYRTLLQRRYKEIARAPDSTGPKTQGGS